MNAKEYNTSATPKLNRGERRNHMGVNVRSTQASHMRAQATPLAQPVRRDNSQRHGHVVLVITKRTEHEGKEPAPRADVTMRLTRSQKVWDTDARQLWVRFTVKSISARRITL